MNESFSEELKKELVKQAIKSLDDPFKMLTVKDVAKDLYMGENKTNEIFNRADFYTLASRLLHKCHIKIFAIFI